MKIDNSISLKLIDMKDANGLFLLTDKSRAHLKEWLPWLDMTRQVEDTRDFIRGCLKGFGENRSLHTIILYNGEIAGSAGFNRINWSNKTAEIGYWLGIEFQGKGIMTEVVKALVDYAFSHLHLNKVEIRAAEGNRKSRSIPEKLGFVEEGTLRQAEWLYDHYVDHVVYGVLEGEWRGSSK